MPPDERREGKDEIVIIRSAAGKSALVAQEHRPDGKPLRGGARHPAVNRYRSETGCSN
jgi:hypothetical protein